MNYLLLLFIKIGKAHINLIREKKWKKTVKIRKEEAEITQNKIKSKNYKKLLTAKPN